MFMTDEIVVINETDSVAVAIREIEKGQTIGNRRKDADRKGRYPRTPQNRSKGDQKGRKGPQVRIPHRLRQAGHR